MKNPGLTGTGGILVPPKNTLVFFGTATESFFAPVSSAKKTCVFWLCEPIIDSQI